MAQTRQFKVTFYPAHRDGNFLVSEINIFSDEYPTHEFEAAGMDDLVRKIETLAADHGKSCKASVRCLSARKPPGFDKATTELYFNLEPVPQGA